MIAKQGIAPIGYLIDSTPTEYSDFVESMIVTKPEDRLMENPLGIVTGKQSFLLLHV